MRKLWLLATVPLAATALVSCGPSGNKPNVELIQDMMRQEAVKPQAEDEMFKGGISEQVPPDHTQPVGNAPYKWGMDLAAAIRENRNPIAGDMNPDTLIKGQKFFETHCKVCHGIGGHGDGPLKAVYPLTIPALISDKVKSMPDAHIYHIITNGQGVMGPYASHVPQNVRWNVVNYIRYLQKTEK